MSDEMKWINFQPFDWRAEEYSYTFQKGEDLTVRCWAKTEKDETVLIRFPNYKYEFVALLPLHDKYGKTIKWTKDNLTQALKSVEKVMGVNVYAQSNRPKRR